jgi:hypothetical protein
MFPLGTSGVGKVMPVTSVSAHPSQDVLEEYVFHRLSETGVAAVEEHILICEKCQDALRDLDEFVLAMRQCEEPGTLPSSGQTGRRRVAGSAVAVAMAAAALALFSILPILHQPSVAKTVQLVALRGGEAGPMIPVQASVPLDLKADVTDLAQSRTYRVEIVNSNGVKISASVSRALSGTLRISTPGLRSGIYWVRLYSGGELQREFGLRAQ